MPWCTNHSKSCVVEISSNKVVRWSSSALSFLNFPRSLLCVANSHAARLAELHQLANKHWFFLSFPIKKRVWSNLLSYLSSCCCLSFEVFSPLLIQYCVKKAPSQWEWNMHKKIKIQENLYLLICQPGSPLLSRVHHAYSVWCDVWHVHIRAPPWEKTNRAARKSTHSPLDISILAFFAVVWIQKCSKHWEIRILWQNSNVRLACERFGVRKMVSVQCVTAKKRSSNPAMGMYPPMDITHTKVTFRQIVQTMFIAMDLSNLNHLRNPESLESRKWSRSMNSTVFSTRFSCLVPRWATNLSTSPSSRLCFGTSMSI